MEKSGILNSWKEIAQFLGRGVRTVQRWEECWGMPVHRPAGKSRSAVVAFADELSAWLKDPRTQVLRAQEQERLPASDGKAHPTTKELHSQHHEFACICQQRTARLAHLTDQLFNRSKHMQEQMLVSIDLRNKLALRISNYGQTGLDDRRPQASLSAEVPSRDSKQIA